ncbi:MAG: hypothetical protein MZV70_77475 [Desulfobacterales bacterium]|nr:hypothetical protein [Desulfobacterales bacterium]
MTGTGDVVITDIKRKTSGLLIEKKIAGKIYIRNSDNILIAELQKPYGREMEVALPEGKYSLLNQADNSVFETEVDIKNDGRYILALNSMTQSSEKKPFTEEIRTPKKITEKSDYMKIKT